MFWDLKLIFRKSWDLVLGFMVTLKYYFLPAITFSYPREKKPVPTRFRGVLSFHPETCIACDMCVRVCPSDVISLSFTRNEQTKRKDLNWYQIDFAKCNFCRLCEEACPTKEKSIHHSNEYEMTFDGREDFIVRWAPGGPNTKDGKPQSQAWYRYMTDGRKELQKRKPEGKN